MTVQATSSGSPAPAVGLSTAEVQSRCERGLVNRMPDDTGRSLAGILSSNVFTVFNGIVGGSFVLLLIIGSWQDALFGFSVVGNTVGRSWAELFWLLLPIAGLIVLIVHLAGPSRQPTAVPPQGASSVPVMTKS